MNPFLYDTVAKPLHNPVFRSRPQAAPNRVPRASSCLTAGLAALAWSACALAVDLNSATLDELRTVRGIGPKTAQTILEERNRGGRFESFEDLSDRIRGIGPRRARALQSAGLSIGTLPAGGAQASGVWTSGQKAVMGEKQSVR